ncbi:MAG: hypothetical protein MOIL_00384 [Candidatus Methanolliviera sp. GoM_oil]|nr:MAG: hypothetical protein MOIL_00384 [Candidatus Methanolliviera sp. GoM_oil]
MKIKADCIPCLIDRAKFECDLALKDEEDKIHTLAEILRFIGNNCERGLSPAFFGTYRDRIIRWRSNNIDHYERLKKEANESAKRLLPLAKRFYEESKDKFKLDALLRIAAAANSMEYGVRGYKFSNRKFEEEFERTLNEELVGNLEEVKMTILNGKNILYLTDNAGEIVFDKFVIEKLDEMGKNIILSPKERAVMNDATVKDAEELKFENKIVPSGSAIGVLLEEANKEFLGYLWNPDFLILAKGMGNYETISSFEDELRGKLIYVLRAKCYSIAEENKVKKGSLVARLVL